jgi:hypothetical protein
LVLVVSEVCAGGYGAGGLEKEAREAWKGLRAGAAVGVQAENMADTLKRLRGRKEGPSRSANSSSSRSLVWRCAAPHLYAEKKGRPDQVDPLFTYPLRLAFPEAREPEADQS